MPAPTGKDTYRNFYLRCIDHFQETFKEKGIKGIFKGFGLVSAFMFLNRSVYFGLYHSFKPHFPNKIDFFISYLLLGIIATYVAMAVSEPLQTIRQMMMGSKDTPSNKFWGISKIMWNLGGVRSFYRSYACTPLRGITGGCMLALYDGFQYVIYQKEY